MRDGADVDAARAGRAPLAQRADLLGHAAHEVVVDRLDHVGALDRDAGLAAVLHRPVDGGVGGALDVGVGEHDHRVLAAELERDRGQRLGGARHDLLAGRGGAGEHHHVDGVDQRGAGVAVAGRDLEDALGQAALAHALGHQQRGQRRDLRRLEHDRVAGGHRRDAVAEGVGQRVVPRPDHADDADRPVAHGELAAGDEQVGRADLLVGEVLRRVLGPEAEGVGGVGDLGQLRVLPRLAGLGDDRLDDPVGVVGHPLLGAAEDPPAALEAERLPGRLRGARTRDQRRDLGRRRGRDRADDLARGGVLDGDLARGRGGVGRGLLDGGHRPRLPHTPMIHRCLRAAEQRINPALRGPAAGRAGRPGAGTTKSRATHDWMHAQRVHGTGRRQPYPAPLTLPAAPPPAGASG